MVCPSVANHVDRGHPVRIRAGGEAVEIYGRVGAANTTRVVPQHRGIAGEEGEIGQTLVPDTNAHRGYSLLRGEKSRAPSRPACSRPPRDHPTALADFQTELSLGGKRFVGRGGVISRGRGSEQSPRTPARGVATNPGIPLMPRSSLGGSRGHFDDTKGRREDSGLCPWWEVSQGRLLTAKDLALAPLRMNYHGPVPFLCSS
jgi:hypothetical protein